MGVTAVESRSNKQFDRMEAMPSAVRQCVYEFGFEIVNACIEAGVTCPHRIRHLVFEIWNGARQPSQRRGKAPGSRVAGKIDWLLIQAGAEISADKLVRVLFQNGFIVVPVEPSPYMIEASMDAVNHMGVVSKSVKHRNRLRAAHKAALKHCWPDLGAA